MPEFRKLAKGVYVFLQPPLICYSSAGVIIGDRDVIVVDSLANAAMTECLLTEIRRITDKPIRFLINTHSHFDHIYTNHLFLEAPVISTHRGAQGNGGQPGGPGQTRCAFRQAFFRCGFRGWPLYPAGYEVQRQVLPYIRENVKSACLNWTRDILNLTWWYICLKKRLSFVATSS